MEGIQSVNQKGIHLIYETKKGEQRMTTEDEQIGCNYLFFI